MSYDLLLCEYCFSVSTLLVRHSEELMYFIYYKSVSMYLITIQTVFI